MRAACGALGERDRTTPAVLLPLHDGDAYHMINDFNHHHQHAVIQPENSGPAAAAAAATKKAEAAEEEAAGEIMASWPRTPRRLGG